MDNQSFFEMHSWEMLNKIEHIRGNYTCTDIQVPLEIVQHITDLNVFRDNNYNIKVKATGSLPTANIVNNKSKSALAGKIIDGGTIVCDTAYNEIITLKYCVNEHYTIHHHLNDDKTNHFEALFSVYHINYDWHKVYKDKNEDTLIEWYLNGVEDSLLYCDSSSVIDNYSRIIKRAGEVVHTLNNNNESHDRNCVYITFNDTGVLLRKVSSKYGPVWSNNVALEYRTSYGRIPDKEEREKISELLSFILGRHLILVGDTSYCNDTVIEANAYHPHSKNAVAECNSNTRQIVPVHSRNFKEHTNYRTFVQELLPVYLELRDDYNMDEVLERYWLANTMPIGVNLPILAGGIETLMKSWFNGNKSKTKGVYMDSKKFESIIVKFTEQLHEMLEDCAYKDRIISKISNCYQMGVNERYFIFLDELGLKHGSAEADCIRGRNAFTHGGGGKDLEDTLQKTKTMFILLGRIFLKLLSYEGEYIDETIIGFPRKNLDDKIS